jgi:Na+/H+ antiporter NhaC
LGFSWALGWSGITRTISSPENLQLYGFLVMIGTLVATFTATGCAAACRQAISTKIKTARMAQYSSMAVSFMLFIDDYLSILTTGYVMRSLTDRFNIPRLKLAYFVHSLASTIVIIAPISSWVATIIAYIDQSGIGVDPKQNIRVLADPFFIYLKSIPFIFYSFLTIGAIWFIIRKDISFGPMLKHEDELQKSAPTHDEEKSNQGIFALCGPLAVLIGGTLIGLLYSGGYYLFGGEYGFIDSIKYNTVPSLVMFLAATAAVITSLLISLYNRSIILSRVPYALWQGVDLMYPAIAMVILASTLSGMLANIIGTGQYLASLMPGTIPMQLLPLIFFIGSFICTIATGSAWGTFGLMIPIAVPMLTSLSNLPFPINPEDLPMLFPVLGAIFSGSICGNHTSPLSETTTMTATSTQTKPLDHTITQFPFAAPVIAASCISYLISGFFITLNIWLNLALSLSCGFAITLIALYLLNRKNN